MRKLISFAALILAAAVLLASCGGVKDAKGNRKKKTPMGWM